jgi:arginyl-tRNA synthetase
MIKYKIKELISQAIKKAHPNVEVPDFSVEEAEEKFGDYSTNAAMILSKTMGEQPADIAPKIIDSIASIEKGEIIVSAEVAEPGFINFKIALPYFQQKISEIVGAGVAYGHSDLGKDLQVNIEFISANPTGPLTLGNGRGGYFGDCLANIFKAYGAQVEREYYINDRGVQILALGHSVLKDKMAVYKGKYIEEIAQKVKSKSLDEAGSQAATILMEEYIKRTIEKMGIKFDTWFSEKSLHDSNLVSEILNMLKKASLTYEKDGALWLKTTEFSDDKDRVLVTREGEHTYFISDIAYHYDKIRRGYDLLIDFWGADHHGYVGRMNAAAEILKKEVNWSGELKILIAQLVRLVSKGEEVKMSKREGTYVTLDELIDEVGQDVTRFFFLERALNTHMDFDLDLAKAHSQKNPVYYIQYAHARICSILNKSQISNIKNQTNTKSQISKLKEPEEIALIKKLIKLPEIVEEIVGDYQVQKLPTYAIELADSFHRFYEKCPVINSGDNNLTAARLLLLKATQIVLKNTLDLMGISAPEKM